jgi:predicted amidophosphoribosyltransferase
MYEALRKRDELDFDCIVPIPLSPKKEEAGEIHRTRLLATELSKLLGTRVVECLSLSRPISKRALLSLGFTGAEIEDKYFDALEVSDKIKNYDRILLVDDVCTRGRTIRSAVRKIRSAHTDAEIAAACAGQMIVKEAVAESAQLTE